MKRGACDTNIRVMRDYRVRIRAERMVFFEELMRSLDFCDYERLEEPVGSMTTSNLKSHSRKEKKVSKVKLSNRNQIDSSDNFRESIDNLREVISRIDARRDQSRRNES